MVILAAVISGDPLLLIGRHGTAKSFLLQRICEALGLDWRHYNASLLNYDDLVGYPLPDDNGELQFIETPASIWGTDAVFLDEISRCRIDLQNKLFPIIHERKVQGIELTNLVHRWAAMNPPPDPDSDDLGSISMGSGYDGSQPLDMALADRFAFVVTVPDWSEFSANQRERLLIESQRPVPADVSARLRSVVDAGQSMLPGILETCGQQLAAYVESVCQLLARTKSGGFELSGRRGVMLLRNIAAVHAAHCLCEVKPMLSDSALLALLHSIPDPARGKSLSRVAIRAAHKSAWDLATLDKTDPQRFLVTETDPARRLKVATQVVDMKRASFSTVVADCLAELPVGGRHAAAAWLFEGEYASRLVASVAEQAGEFFSMCLTPPEIEETVYVGSARHRNWTAIQGLISRRGRKRKRADQLKHLLLSAFHRKELDWQTAPGEVASNWDDAWEILEGERP